MDFNEQLAPLVGEEDAIARSLRTPNQQSRVASRKQQAEKAEEISKEDAVRAEQQQSNVIQSVGNSVAKGLGAVADKLTIVPIGSAYASYRQSQQEEPNTDTPFQAAFKASRASASKEVGETVAEPDEQDYDHVLQTGTMVAAKASEYTGMSRMTIPEFLESDKSGSAETIQARYKVYQDSLTDWQTNSKQFEQEMENTGFFKHFSVGLGLDKYDTKAAYIESSQALEGAGKALQGAHQMVGTIRGIQAQKLAAASADLRNKTAGLNDKYVAGLSTKILQSGMASTADSATLMATAFSKGQISDAEVHRQITNSIFSADAQRYGQSTNLYATLSTDVRTDSSDLYKVAVQRAASTTMRSAVTAKLIEANGGESEWAVLDKAVKAKAINDGMNSELTKLLVDGDATTMEKYSLSMKVDLDEVFVDASEANTAKYLQEFGGSEEEIAAQLAEVRATMQKSDDPEYTQSEAFHSSLSALGNNLREKRKQGTINTNDLRLQAKVFADTVKQSNLIASQSLGTGLKRMTIQVGNGISVDLTDEVDVAEFMFRKANVKSWYEF